MGDHFISRKERPHNEALMGQTQFSVNVLGKQYPVILLSGEGSLVSNRYISSMCHRIQDKIIWLNKTVRFESFCPGILKNHHVWSCITFYTRKTLCLALRLNLSPQVEMVKRSRPLFESLGTTSILVLLIIITLIHCRSRTFQSTLSQKICHVFI